MTYLGPHTVLTQLPKLKGALPGHPHDFINISCFSDVHTVVNFNSLGKGTFWKIWHLIQN